MMANASAEPLCLCVCDLSEDPFWRVPVSLMASLQSQLPSHVKLLHVTDKKQFLDAIKTAHIIVGFPFPANLVRGNTHLRWVHFWTAQVPSSWDRLRARVKITDSRGLNSDSVVDHAMFLIYKALRREPFHSYERAWDPRLFGIADNPHYKSLGVMGFGEIGERLVSRCRGFFQHIRVMSRTKPAQDHVDWFAPAALQDFLRDLDYVVMALPLSPETKSLFGAGFYQALRPGATLINLARGELIDESLLLQHLQEDTEFRYMADVAAPEPYPADGVLITHPRVFLTPHIGGRREGIWDDLGERTLTLIKQNID